MAKPEHTFFHGPLRRNPANPRYFTDDTGRAIYLAGSHTWSNLVDMRQPGDPPFDYGEYLDFLCTNHHNYMRLWAWHHGPRGISWSDRPVEIDPSPYLRPGPGLAADGLPRFDLLRFNQAYFDRMRQRVMLAGERGIYVSVMFFLGGMLSRASAETPGDTWTYHPYNAANNVNGFNGDPNGDGISEVFNVEQAVAQTYLQAYVRQVVDTVSDLDNVFYEVANELHFEGGGLAWQQATAEYIRAYERNKLKQHPVGITADGSGKDYNDELLDSAVDWIAPYFGPQNEYMYNPPASDERKVVIADTDHLWGIGGNYRWVWKSFTRGLNTAFMDPWVPLVAGELTPWSAFNTRNYPEYGPVRMNLGATRMYAEQLDLNVCLPHGELATSGYCLADPGRTYLVYVPDDARVFMDLTAAPGKLAVEWFSPRDGTRVTAPAVQGGTRWLQFMSPLGMDVVLYLYTRSQF